MEQSIIAGNILIAEFDGDRIVVRPYGDALPGRNAYYYIRSKDKAEFYLSLDNGTDNTVYEAWCKEAAKFDFHTNYNSLMSIVDKIESLGWKFQICRRRVDIQPDAPTFKAEHHFIIKEDTKIASVYKAIVTFIEWYNSQNK